MPIIARDNRTDLKPAPEGLHQAVCCDVVDLGLVTGKWGEKHMVQLRWQLDLEDPETQRRYMVVNRYNLSLSSGRGKKAALLSLLEAWRGRLFTKEELKGFDLENLVGANCQLQIVHNVSDNGTTYGNVQAIVPIGRGMVKMQVSEDYIRVKDRDDKKPEEAPPPDDEDLPF